jgi:hypothetical protein
MDEAEEVPSAMESEDALSAAIKVSRMDPVEVTNDIFEKEQLKVPQHSHHSSLWLSNQNSME